MGRFPRHRPVYLAAFILTLGLALGVRAQDPTEPALARLPGALTQKDASIKITSTIDKVVIRVGDLIHYTLEIEAPQGSKVMMPPPGAELGRFIIREFDAPGMDAEEEKGWTERMGKWLGGGGDGSVRQEFRFTITAYDTGDLAIPPMPFAVVDPAGKSHAFFTESARVRVVPFTNPEDLTIRDVKAPVDIPVPARLYLPYVLVPLVVLAAIAAAVVMIARRRREDEEQAAPRPAHEVALDALSALEREDLLAKGEYENYYTRLSSILRRYLGMRYLFYALEYTTVEIVATLKEKDIGHGDYERVRGLLSGFDLVKFARQEPAADDRNSALGRVRDLVGRTREPDLLAPSSREAA